MADYPACMGAHEVLRRASKGKTLRVRDSDGRRRAKPSGFAAPTGVEEQNPQGSWLRRASKGKTLRVHGSDGRRRRRTLPVLVPPVLVEGHEDDDARGDDGKDGHKVHRRAVSEEHVDQKEPQKKDAHGLGVADLAARHDGVRFGVVYGGSMGGMCTLKWAFGYISMRICTPKWVFGYMLRRRIDHEKGRLWLTKRLTNEALM